MVLSRYKWIGLLDVDEIIVPRKQSSLPEMINQIESEEEDDEGHTSWYFTVFYWLHHNHNLEFHIKVLFQCVLPGQHDRYEQS